MKIIIVDIVDDRDKKELYQSTTSLDCMFGINTNGIIKIGDNEIHLDEIDFVCVDDNSYTNKDFENIYRDLHEATKEITRKNGMLNIKGETRIYKGVKYKSLMIYSYID